MSGPVSLLDTFIFKGKENRMRHFKTNAFSVAAVCSMAVLLVLAGCGKKEEAVTTTTTTTTIATDQADQQTAMPAPSSAPITEERTFYDFERDLGAWEVPLWAEGKVDHVAKNLEVSQDVASKGMKSMKMDTDFPGGMWTAGLVEIQQYLDLSPYRVIMVDIYLPEGAPLGLKGKVILTVGETWKFVEMNSSTPLLPGEWVTIVGSIEPGSYDWKRVIPDEKFAEDIRKVAIRVESNRKPKYSGPIYIDNIRVGR